GRKLVLHDSPKLRIDDSAVLARVGDALVNDLAPIDSVLEHQVERASGKALAAGELSARSLPSLAHDAGPLELRLQQRDRAELGVAPEDRPDARRLRRVDDQLAILDIVAERDVAAHPHALGLRRGDLVADALARDLAL